MKVEFSKDAAQLISSDPDFGFVVEEVVRTFNPKYESKLVYFKTFGLLLHRETEDYLKVSICR